MNLDFSTMPKVELHLHLEGAIPLEAMWRLVELHGGDPEVPNPKALVERYAYTDFDHFIETWVWKNRFLDTVEAFELAAEAVARSLVEQHIVYAEAFFSPTDFAMYGLTPQDLAVAIRRGLDRVKATSVALIADLVRDTGPERAMRTLSQVREVMDEAGVIGIGIGGTEARFPPEPFAGVYRQAEASGFHRTAHAGEAAGPQSVAGAVDQLGVERIGHGIRAVEDPRVLARLVEARIPLEVCPTSNLRTGVVPSWNEHPLPQLVAAGAVVTVNTDDPAMFHCDLAGEYRILVDRFGLDVATVEQIAHAAIDASWADEATKARLQSDLARWWRDRSASGTGR